MFPRIHPAHTDPSTLQYGWKAKSDAAKKAHAAANDPIRLAVTSVRARMRDLGDARAIAEAEFAEIHATVPSPIPAQVHPDVAAVLTAFMRKAGLEGVDLTRPVSPHENVELIEARHRARLQADLEDAQAELARVEREQAVARLQEAQRALDTVDANHARQAAYVEPEPETGHVDPVPAVPSPDVIASALAEQDVVVASVAEDTPRRRGRPPGPRISLDRDADDAALPVN